MWLPVTGAGHPAALVVLGFDLDADKPFVVNVVGEDIDPLAITGSHHSIASTTADLGGNEVLTGITDLLRLQFRMRRHAAQCPSCLRLRPPWWGVVTDSREVALVSPDFYQTSVLPTSISVDHVQSQV